VFNGPKLLVEVDSRGASTPYGGLALVVGLLRQVGAAAVIDRIVHVLERHSPYHESDHVIAQTMSMIIGGECIEDVAVIQHDKGLLRMLGARRSPDPTTAGDFLRRFDARVRPGALGELRQAVNTIQDAIWKRVQKHRPKVQRRLGSWGFVDLDSHVAPTYGRQKQDADFAYNGQWGFHPLIVSLANTGEILDTVQRPGNVHSATGAADSLERVLPLAFRRYGFGNLLVRGDSAFDQAAVRAACERHGAAYALVAKEVGQKPRSAAAIEEDDWEEFVPRGRRLRLAREAQRSQTRARGLDELDAKVVERRYHVRRKEAIQVAEVPFRPTGATSVARLIILRERLSDRTFEGQFFLLRQAYEFRYIVTNLPPGYSAAEVVDLTYERCDQENVIEQFKNGLPGWHVPVREFDGNAAWLEIARLAWNLMKAVALLGLPDDAVRWQCKRFRRTVILIAATILHRSRQTWIRITGSLLYAPLFQTAHARLCT
jgi:hypothetical protein